MDKTENIIISIGIFGKINSGKCSLSKNLSINYGNIANPNKFEINNIEYHIFPIPCAGPEYNDNYDISINNCDISFIIIDVSENFDQIFLIKLIGDIICHGINKIFILFNKIDKVNFDESIKKKFEDDINVIIHKFNSFFNLNKIELKYFSTNIKDNDGINKIIDEIKNLTFENKEKENLLIPIFDKYYDNDDKKFVITGKILLGTVNINSILNYKTINSKKIILNKNIKPLKISKANGIYIENNITNNEFISIKFDIRNFEEQSNYISKNAFIIEKENEDIAIFDTIEADIIFINSPCPIIAKGFDCLFSNYNCNLECQIINIQGKFDENMKLQKKNSLSTSLYESGKVIIQIKEPILSMKYENNFKVGVFNLKKSGEIFAFGKIIKYKKYKI
jgi:translation elongation factor EF-1alpha